MKLLDLVPPGAVIADLASGDRSGVVRELALKLAECGRLQAAAVDAVVKSILARERSRGTTGIGRGVALPHAKIDGIERVIAAVGRSTAGIDFQSLDGEPVHAVFLILSPESQPEEHLRAMDLVFRHVQHERFRKFLRQADQAAKIMELLKEADEKLLLA